MKKLFVLAIVALVAVGSVFAEDVLKSTTTNDSLTVTANVGYRLIADLDGDISFDVNADATEATGVDSKANLNIVSNRRTWKVVFSSANSGELRSGTLTPIPYKVQLALVSGQTWGGTVTGLSNFTKLSAPTDFVGSVDARTGTAGVNFTLAVALDAPGDGKLWEEGSYNDTITVTISAS